MRPQNNEPIIKIHRQEIVEDLLGGQIIMVERTYVQEADTGAEVLVMRRAHNTGQSQAEYLAQLKKSKKALLEEQKKERKDADERIKRVKGLKNKKPKTDK